MQRRFTDEEMSLPQDVREELVRREVGPPTLADVMRELRELKAMVRDLRDAGKK